MQPNVPNHRNRHFNVENVENDPMNITDLSKITFWILKSRFSSKNGTHGRYQNVIFEDKKEYFSTNTSYIKRIMVYDKENHHISSKHFLIFKKNHFLCVQGAKYSLPHLKNPHTYVFKGVFR